MKTLLRWLIFNGLAPKRSWFRAAVQHHLHRYNVYGDSMIDLGPRATPRQVHAFREWWRNDR